LFWGQNNDPKSTSSSGTTPTSPSSASWRRSRCARRVISSRARGRCFPPPP